MSPRIGLLLGVALAGAVFPGSTAVAYPETGIKPGVVRDKNPRPKGRGARRREAKARKKGGK